MATVFNGQRSGESLDEFAQRKVSMTDTENRRFNEQVDRFVRYLHEQPFCSGYSVKEVIKNGSLGKGTAVRGLADIDLVVFVNGLGDIDALAKAREKLLTDLKRKLWTSLQIDPKDSSQYSLTYEWNDIEVDILPAVDVLSVYGSPRRVYDVMAQCKSTAYAAKQFSASLAPLQREFVREVPEHVKKVIRLVKLWKKENHLDIKSYSLELLTIFVWRSLGKGNPGTASLFREVMRQLATCGTLRVAFDDNYNSGTYTRNTRDPYILDPANPYMNTLHGVSIGEVSECAKRTLKKI